MKKQINGSLIRSILGIVVSIIVIMTGLSVCKDADESFVKSNTKFGADFYTEIFEEVEQVKASTRGIENAVYEVGGQLIVLMGALGVCYFSAPVIDLFLSGKKQEDSVQLAEETCEISE